MRKGIVLIVLATMLLASCRMPVESQTETTFDILHIAERNSRECGAERSRSGVSGLIL